MSEKQNWNSHASETLLLLWGRDTMEKQLKQLKMDQDIFEKISEVLHELGYNFSWKQCHTKLKNIIQTYRRVKKNALAGGAEPDCLFYSELDYIFNPSEVPMPPLFQRFQEQDGGLMVAKDNIVVVSPISTTNSSDRSSTSPTRTRPPDINNSSTILRQLPVLRVAGASGNGDCEVPLMVPTLIRSTERLRESMLPGLPTIGSVPRTTERPSEPLSPVLPTVCTIDRSSEEPARHADLEVELVSEVPVVASSSGNDREPQPSLEKGFSHKRKVKDGDMFELLLLLQEQAEDREDARQQRLMEHERRMEESRQQWEEQRRQRELQLLQQWEEKRRERDFQLLQQVSQMFMQTMQQLSQKESLEEP